MIEIVNLTKSFPDGQTVLRNVNATFGPGELVVILGSSGSGKTTLLRCLNLQESWSKGKLFYNGQDILELGLRGKLLIRKNWSYVKEQSDLNLRKSALKNVLAGSRKHRAWWRLLLGSIPEDEHVNAMDYLENVGLLDKGRNTLEKMSGGEVRRVAVAKALAQGAKVIVADEPVSNLDPHSAYAIMEDIRRMCEKKQVTFICTLRDVELAEKFATRLVGLADGKLAFNVSGRRLMQQERSLIL